MTARLREALEAALRENPDDLAAHMAWADHAAECGDPRGEYAQVQIALEDATRSAAEREELKARETELMKAFGDEWLGPMVGLFESADPFGIEPFNPDKLPIRFARGWLDTLHFASITPALLEAVTTCPTAGLLREFAVNRGEDYDQPDLAWFERLPFLRTLRTFRLGDRVDNCRLAGEGIAAALSKMPRLEELALYTSASELNEVFALPLRNLRTLIAHHQDNYPLDVLGDNPAMANLVTVDCFAHALRPDDDVAYIRSDPFVRFARSPHLRSLTHLMIRVHEIGDAGLAALVESGMLRRLQTLDLWSGNISDVGARTLAASGQLNGLKKLDLSQNYLTDEGLAALRATGVPLEAANMYNPSDLGTEDREHLWNGDME